MIAIYLGERLPERSSDLPEGQMDRTSPSFLFGLAPGGVCRASLSPGCWWALTLMNLHSPAISPLPFWGGIFLLHFPYPYATHNEACYFGRWELPTTVSYGARTFLSHFFQSSSDYPTSL